jgi:hypothetical protein
MGNWTDAKKVVRGGAGKAIVTVQGKKKQVGAEREQSKGRSGKIDKNKNRKIKIEKTRKKVGHTRR